MNAKQIVFHEQARGRMLAGVEALAAAVRVTLGPQGRHVVLQKPWGPPTVTRDGITVAREIELSDRVQDAGARMVREAAARTSEVVGDGTTTATVLAHAILRGGLKQVVAGADPMALRRGIDAAVAAVVQELARQARPTSGHTEIARVGAVSANGDRAMGDIIAGAMEKVGRDGVITLEEARSIETTLEVVEGMKLDRGYLSAYFVTDAGRMEAVLEDAYLLIHEKKLSSLQSLLPLLELVAGTGRPLLVVAGEVEGEALNALVANRLRGTLGCCAIKAPGFGDRRRATLEDLAVVTGGTAVTEDLGLKLEKITLAELGLARRVVVDRDSATIVDGAGSREQIRARTDQIRRQIEETTSDYDREKLQERLARLLGGVAVISVGAATEPELKEKKARLEDALNATRAAVEEGVVAGGGVALLRCQGALDGLQVPGEEQAGVAVLRRALEEPLRCIGQNAGVDGGVVVSRVRAREGGFGYNARTERYEDLVEAGVIDPAKVVRVALQNAASVAGLMLTTEAMVASKTRR